MRRLLWACLMIVSCGALAGPGAPHDTPTTHCGKFSKTDEVSKPMTIAEIERQQMALLPQNLELRSDYPRVPFGFINAEWKAFKSMIRPGDKIVAYSSDALSWQALAGETGYALIRAGCVIELFRTSWN